jgi:hypothetical protein
MSTFKQDHADLQTRLIQQNQETADAKYWLAFIEKHREIVPCQANFQLMKSYFAGDPFSPGALEEAISNPSLRTQIAFQSNEEDRIKLLQALKNLTGEIPAATKYQSTEEIRSTVNGITEKREMQSKSPAELRQIIKSGTTTTPVEQELPAEMTRQHILALPVAELRRVIDKYGTPAVNRRLAGTSI